MTVNYRTNDLLRNHRLESTVL